MVSSFASSPRKTGFPPGGWADLQKETHGKKSQGKRAPSGFPASRFFTNPESPKSFTPRVRPHRRPDPRGHSAAEEKDRRFCQPEIRLPTCQTATLAPLFFFPVPKKDTREHSR